MTSPAAGGSLRVMDITITIPEMTCQKCGATAPMQPHLLYLQGRAPQRLQAALGAVTHERPDASAADSYGRSWNIVCDDKPAGWMKGPSASDLCGPCGALWVESAKTFLAPPAPALEPLPASPPEPLRIVTRSPPTAGPQRPPKPPARVVAPSAPVVHRAPPRAPRVVSTRQAKAMKKVAARAVRRKLRKPARQAPLAVQQLPRLTAGPSGSVPKTNPGSSVALPAFATPAMKRGAALRQTQVPAPLPPPVFAAPKTNFGSTVPVPAASPMLGRRKRAPMSPAPNS